MTEVNDRPIVTKAQYFIGKSCKSCGSSERYVKTKKCINCNRNNLTRLRTLDNARYKNYQKKHKPTTIKCALAWRDRNSEKVKEYKRQSAKRNKLTTLKWREKNRSRVLQKRRSWSKRNKDKLKIQKKKDYEKHKEKRRLTCNKWAIKNFDKIRSYKTNAKAKRRKAQGKHSAKEIRELLERQKYKCTECNCKISLKPDTGELRMHLDHILPIVLGGSNDIKNLQCLCPSCNLTKGAKHPLEWAKMKGRLL